MGIHLPSADPQGWECPVWVWSPLLLFVISLQILGSHPGFGSHLCLCSSYPFLCGLLPLTRCGRSFLPIFIFRVNYNGCTCLGGSMAQGELRIILLCVFLNMFLNSLLSTFSPSHHILPIIVYCFYLFHLKTNKLIISFKYFNVHYIHTYQLSCFLFFS